MDSRGLFIVLEGPEGSGKSTMALLLTEYLEACGHEVVSKREPGGTPVGELIRKILLQENVPEEKKVKVPPLTEFLLFLASRSAFVSEFVRPSLAEGKIVIADRFDLSTVAYQIAGRQLSLEEALLANKFAKDGLVPDLVILLTVAYEVGVERQRKQGKKADRIEQESEEFHRIVREAYEQFFFKRPNHVKINTTGADRVTVFRDIRGYVDDLLERRK